VNKLQGKHVNENPGGNAAENEKHAAIMIG